MPPPKIPTIIGSTTDSVNKADIAASTALPPAASIAAPAADATGWLATTMPRAPEAGRFSQSNGASVRWRQAGAVIGEASAGQAGEEVGPGLGAAAMKDRSEPPRSRRAP